MAVVKHSAGLLGYRIRDELEVLLAHPGGPFWATKDRGAWTIPKGEVNPGEASQDAAKREFFEETGFQADGELLELGEIFQKSGKRVEAWAIEGDWDPTELTSIDFEMEWPPRSGRFGMYPEVDRAEWLTPQAAKAKIIPAQADFISRLEEILSSRV